MTRIQAGRRAPRRRCWRASSWISRLCGRPPTESLRSSWRYKSGLRGLACVIACVFARALACLPVARRVNDCLPDCAPDCFELARPRRGFVIVAWLAHLGEFHCGDERILARHLDECLGG